MARRDFWGLGPSRGPVGWALALVIGGLWWWAVLRLLVEPGRVGPVEGAVVAGGWGLSLLPVHCVPWSKKDRGGGGRRGRQPRSEGVRGAGAPIREAEGIRTPEPLAEPAATGPAAIDPLATDPLATDPLAIRPAATGPTEVTRAYGRRRWCGGSGRS